MLTERINHNFTTLIEAIEAAKSEGASMEFIANKKGFYDMETGRTYVPESIKKMESIIIDAPFSEPDARSIVYILETVDGDKGWISDAHGFYADDVLMQHIERIKENYTYSI